MNENELPKFNLIREVPVYNKGLRYDFFAQEKIETDENLTINNLEKIEMELCNLAC